MIEPKPETSPDAESDVDAAVPEFRAAQRWNMVWVIPILALLIGGWLVYQNINSQGPVVQIQFDTADGIAQGKTEVRCRSVRVGMVEEVQLADDLHSVIVFVRIDPKSADLLRKGTRFWVVRPRVSTTDISGLGTLLTGAYLELDPGSGPTAREERYQGLETPPATSRSIPGRRLVLSAEEAGSLMPGSPIYFRGYEVGRIESRTLQPEGDRVTYEAFIQEQYAALVTTNTRFWNTSGIDISAGTDGFKVRTPSFQAMVSGGAEFGVPKDFPAGEAIRDGMTFTLYPDKDAAVKSTFAPTLKFLLLFDQSVRGLSDGAPVEFRGIPIGRVADISFDYTEGSAERRIPVLIEIDPSLLRAQTAEKMADVNSPFMADAVGRGLRAALKTGSLLTGSLFVDLDYYPDALPAEIVLTGELRTLPTVSSGLAQLEAKVTAILDKLQALPLDETLQKIGSAAEESATTIAEARATLDEIEATAASARVMLDDPEFRNLPKELRLTLDELKSSISSVGPDGAIQGDLLRTLDELRGSLRSIKSLTTTIEEKPSSLLFGKDSSGNPIPRAPRKN